MQLAIFNPDIPRSRGIEAIDLIRQRWTIDNMPPSNEQAKAFLQWKRAVANFMNNQTVGA